jgi:penicillin-insensitive murein DD-endopeptidase
VTRRLLVAACLVAAWLLPAEAVGRGSSGKPADLWGRVRTPAPGPARAIGGYSSGCVIGAVRLPAKGGGYRVGRPERRRDFGHPALVAFVRELGAAVARERLGLLTVGDLGQPRGGPAKGGHASHQSGLDVDLWYALGERRRGARAPLPMVDRKTQRPTRHLDARVRRVIEIAASDPRVERVIVNPVIKRELCERVEGERAWLRKLRPWWGHDEHFHVRLACPADSPDCEAQPAMPEGDGCADVAWWFRKEDEKARAQKRQGYRARIGGGLELPAICLKLLE